MSLVRSGRKERRACRWRPQVHSFAECSLSTELGKGITRHPRYLRVSGKFSYISLSFEFPPEILGPGIREVSMCFGKERMADRRNRCFLRAYSEPRLVSVGSAKALFRMLPKSSHHFFSLWSCINLQRPLSEFYGVKTKLRSKLALLASALPKIQFR